MPTIAQARPISSWIPVRTTARVAWGLAGGACACVLMVAAWLTPDARGFGTHEALGMPPCGFVVVSGLPCPTCGMTTAFAHAVRGQLAQAFLAQPAGLLLCLASMAVAPVGLLIGFWGRMPAWALRDWDRVSVRLMLGFAFTILLGWGFKIIYSLCG